MSQNIIPSPEYVPLAPEDAEIVNTYLETMDMEITASQLGIEIHQVSSYLQKPAVQRYITEIFLNTGYRNRFKLAKVLDDIVDKKLAELLESETTSSKDILDILEMIMKFRKEERDHERKLLEIQMGTPKKQTNIQINNPYSEFTTKLLDLKDLT